MRLVDIPNTGGKNPKPHGRFIYKTEVDFFLRELKNSLCAAYECVENGRYDEALLHIGHAHAKVGKEI